MHYAIVKCERVQEEWKYRYNNESINFWKAYANKELRSILRETDREMIRMYRGQLSSSLEGWNRKLLENNSHLHQTYIKNGQCILWEGKVNQERLRVTDNLFIPTLDKYLEISKVETTPNGEVTYYVNYTKKFYDTAEQSRLKAIEAWIIKEYSSINNFEEMKEYIDSPNEYRKEYEDFLEYVESKLNPNRQSILNQVEWDIVEPKKEVVVDAEDLKWQKIALISALGFVGLVTLVILVSIIN